MKLIARKRDRIEISCPYSDGLKERIKLLPDREWDKENKVWWLPATPFHAKHVLAFGREHGFQLEIGVLKLVTTPNIKPKNRDRLLQYQNYAVDFLHVNKNALIADAMGLGKTVEALTYLNEIDAKRVLVIAPASVVGKWQQEVRTWTASTVSILKTGKDSVPESTYVIVSYGLVPTVYAKLRSVEWDVLVLDECHYISNPDAQRSRAVRAITARQIIGLSGTPFLNRPIEMFNFLNMIAPGQFHSKWKYAQRYCDLKHNGFGWEMKGATNTTELAERLKSIFLRRTKQDVADQLPSLTRSILPIQSNGHVVRRSRKYTIQDITKLRHEIGMTKVPVTIELAEDVLADPDRKLVIFCWHLDVVAELFKALKKYGVLKIVGEMPRADRDHAIDLFQTAPAWRVMIITKAGGEGINLYAASDIIMAERAWNPGIEEQVESRLHRIGQNNPVTAYYPILSGSLDEVVHELIEEKRVVFGDVIGNQYVETNIMTDLMEKLNANT